MVLSPGIRKSAYMSRSRGVSAPGLGRARRLLRRMRQLVALGVFHCGAQNFDAIGGTADINWPPAPIASEAYDP